MRRFTADLDPSTDAQPIDLSIDQTVDRLRSDLEWIAVPRHPRANPTAHAEVAAAIESSLTDSGFRVRREPFTEAGHSGVNLVGDLPANGSADSPTDSAPWIVLGAHYDSVKGTPGADDNGSAVAALLECGRRLGARAAASRRRGLRLVAFDLEEAQDGEGLLGSRAACRTWRRHGDPIAAMLCLEMVGYTDRAPHSQRLPPGFTHLFPDLAAWLDARSWRGDFLTAIADSGSEALLTQCVAAGTDAAPTLPIVPFTAPVDADALPDLLRSDHAPFWAAGIPALMLTDTSEYRNPHYHRTSDTVDTLDLPFLAAVCDAVIAMLENLLAETDP
ncbi:MAG: M28 family peptidase [Acidobacteriota bacterium]